MNSKIDSEIIKLYDTIKYDYYLEQVDNTLSVTLGRKVDGKIKLKGKSKIITNKQIENVINLLHDDYKNLGTTVYFVKNTIHGLLKTVNPIRPAYCLEFKKVYNATVNSMAYYVIGANDIFMNDLYFKNDDLEGLKLSYILSLIHELRHAWQDKNKKFITDKYIDSGRKGYLSQPCEKDADKFAMRFMNNNKNEITEILGIKTNWYCNYRQIVLSN